MGACRSLASVSYVLAPDFIVVLPQPNRLRYRRDFQAVYQKGLRRSGRCLTLRGLRSSTSSVDTSTQQNARLIDQGKPATRIGISISQKVSKKAVVRNRIKRQIRAVFRYLLPRLLPGWQLVVVVRPEAKECDYGQFLRELEQLLADIEVLNGH